MKGDCLSSIQDVHLRRYEEGKWIELLFKRHKEFRERLWLMNKKHLQVALTVDQAYVKRTSEITEQELGGIRISRAELEQHLDVNFTRQQQHFAQNAGGAVMSRKEYDPYVTLVLSKETVFVEPAAACDVVHPPQGGAVFKPCSTREWEDFIADVENTMKVSAQFLKTFMAMEQIFCLTFHLFSSRNQKTHVRTMMCTIF